MTRGTHVSLAERRSNEWSQSEYNMLTRSKGVWVWCLRPISIEVSWVLNTLTWRCIDEDRDDESFMGVEIVS
jgi:hypothetical protein